MKQPERLLLKSIGKRQKSLWRMAHDTAPDQRSLQSFNPLTYPGVGLTPHSVRSCWHRIDYRTRAAEPLPKPISLQIGSCLLASTLALIDRVAAARSAVITAQSLEQTGHASFAKRAMDPWSGAAIVWLTVAASVLIVQ